MCQTVPNLSVCVREVGQADLESGEGQGIREGEVESVMHGQTNMNKTGTYIHPNLTYIRPNLTYIRPNVYQG